MLMMESGSYEYDDEGPSGGEDRMPFFSNLHNLFGGPAKRSKVDSAVVIDVGKRYIKIGFAGESEPRNVINSPPPPKSEDYFPLNSKTWERYFSSLLEKVYFDVLQVNPSDFRVIVIEDLYWTYSFKKGLMNALYNLGLLGVLTVPGPLSPFYLLGKSHSHGMSIDIGYSETRVAAICDRCVYLPSLCCVPLGFSQIIKRFKNILIEDCKIECGGELMDYQGRKQGSVQYLCGVSLRDYFMLNTSVVEEIPESDLENLITSYSFVTIRSSVSGAFKNEFREIRYSTYLLDSRTKRRKLARIRIGSEQRIKASEVLFENIEIPGEGIVSNLFFSGGGASIPGLYDRFIMELDLLLVRRTTELTPLAGRYTSIIKMHFPDLVIRSWLGSSVLCKAGLNEECFQRRRYRNLRDVPDWTNPPLESPDSPDDNEEYLTGEAGEDNDAKQGERSSPSVKYGTGSVSRMSVKKEEEVKNQEGKGLSALERFRLAAGAAAEASNSPTGSPVKIPPPPSELPRTHGATSKLKLASSRLRIGTTRTRSNT
eukprot:jgi/Bigna1/69355/fgenesh1_pg.8_\